MVKQMGGYWRGLWIFPGGKLEPGETLEQCARREFIEETECDLTIKKEIGAYVSYDPDTEFEKQVVLVYFLADITAGTPKVGEGVTDIAWFTMEQVQDMEIQGKTPKLILQVAKDSIR